MCGLPTVLAIIGLFNVPVASTQAPVSSLPQQHSVRLLRDDRAHTLLAPRSDVTFYIFAAGLGFTWLA